MDTPTAGDPAAKRSRAATRARLLATSAAVFAEKGIEGASVEELCAAAGFSRGAFYSNFASKTDLALAMYEDHVGQLITRLDDQLETWLAAGEPTATVVGRVVEGMSDFTSDTTWHSVRLELLLAARRSPRVREVVSEQRAALTAAVTEALGRVADHQGLAFTVEAGELAGLLLSAYDGRLNDQLAGTGHAPAGPGLVPTVWLAFTRPGARP
ncbi:TetR/AcrR family transcriptional regulator [Kocuria sp. U4B]